MENYPICLGLLNECHLQCVPCLEAEQEVISLQNKIIDFKATFAKPWNFVVKPWIKRRYKKVKRIFTQGKNRVDFLRPNIDTTEKTLPPLQNDLQAGDWVRVKPAEEIKAMLDIFNEYKGCAYLEDMNQYWGTVQRVFVKVERFLDERDYKMKTSNGLVYLENLCCTGTKVFGRCDRRCFYFWRVEWLDKLDEASVPVESIPDRLQAT